MKNALIIVLFTLSTAVSATTYYIDPSGNNANNGSGSSPWKTLTYACSKVTTPGDIIHVNAGTFTETSQCILALGISIVGVGNTSIIHSHFSAGNLIELYSSSTVNGNQSISYIQMEGGTSVSDLVGNTAIKVWGRSNVNIHHCTFQNFSTMGVIFYGGATVPTTFPTGCQFHDNIVTNCSKMLPGQGDTGEGSLCIGGTQGMLVFNNTITCNLRVSGNNGYPIKFAGEGVNKGLKIYNNTLTADHCPDGGGFNFAIELWNSAGGCEIYNNIIKGTVDIASSNNDMSYNGVPYPEGAYAFGTKLYNNTIGWDTQMPIGTGDGEFGIRLEATQNYTYVYNNHIKNEGLGIECNMYSTTPAQYQNNIYIYYNIFENIGSSSAINSKGWGIHIAGGIGSLYDNWNILNNVFSAKTSGGGSTMYGVGIPGGIDGNVVTNITIRNNIIQNFSYAAIEGSSSAYSADGVSIENNIFYNNGYNNAVRSNTTGWLHYTNQNNKPGVVSLFVSTTNFNIQSNSPAINAGLDVGLTTDYAGNAVQNPPEIGAYEYASNPPSPVIPVIPVYQNSVVENATPSLLEMTYNLNLNNSVVPSTSSFNILVNSVAKTVSSFAISGNKVQLTLASAIKSGDIITVSYTKPASNPLQTSLGGQAITISAQPVVNNCINATNTPPVVTISNPRKGNKYENPATITIDAVASDPDGTISKVEFYSGEVKLVELTSAPYTYTWKDVKPGIYSITAIATDNLNATTTSLPIEFKVGANIKYDANSEIVNLYPNPNDGHFSIEFINPLQNEKSELVITDLAGKQVYIGPVLKEETIKQIDLSYVKSGIYILMIIYKGILVTKKIIIN